MNISSTICRHSVGSIIALAAIMPLPSVAHAALGENAATVDKDRETLHATVRIVPRTGYRMHELVMPVGSTVRQYEAAKTGKVFAVSWSGGWRPDLSALMGAYYERYLESQKGKRRTRGPVKVELPGMVMFMGGYLRTFFGYAYLTDQLPPGFDPRSFR